MVAAGFVLGAAYNRHGPDDAPKETTARSTKRGEYWLLRPDLATRPRRRCARNKDALREVKVTADDASIIRTGFRLRYDLLGTARRCGLHYSRYINQRRFKRVFHYLPANYLLLLGKYDARSGIIGALYS